MCFSFDKREPLTINFMQSNVDAVGSTQVSFREVLRGHG